ncbi:MAG: hypothetical protein FWE38_00275 [Firmicutes bacterium]|nr:hypothetical protein [Bacillota bacterium]
MTRRLKAILAVVVAVVLVVPSVFLIIHFTRDRDNEPDEPDVPDPIAQRHSLRGITLNGIRLDDGFDAIVEGLRVPLVAALNDPAFRLELRELIQTELIPLLYEQNPILAGVLTDLILNAMEQSEAAAIELARLLHEYLMSGDQILSDAHMLRTLVRSILLGPDGDWLLAQIAPTLNTLLAQAGLSGQGAVRDLLLGVLNGMIDEVMPGLTGPGAIRLMLLDLLPAEMREPGFIRDTALAMLIDMVPELANAGAGRALVLDLLVSMVPELANPGFVRNLTLDALASLINPEVNGMLPGAEYPEVVPPFVFDIRETGALHNLLIALIADMEPELAEPGAIRELLIQFLVDEFNNQTAFDVYYEDTGLFGITVGGLLLNTPTPETGAVRPAILRAWRETPEFQAWLEGPFADFMELYDAQQGAWQADVANYENVLVPQWESDAAAWDATYAWDNDTWNAYVAGFDADRNAFLAAARTHIIPLTGTDIYPTGVGTGDNARAGQWILDIFALEEELLFYQGTTNIRADHNTFFRNFVWHDPSIGSAPAGFDYGWNPDYRLYREWLLGDGHNEEASRVFFRRQMTGKNNDEETLTGTWNQTVRQAAFTPPGAPLRPVRPTAPVRPAAPDFTPFQPTDVHGALRMNVNTGGSFHDRLRDFTPADDEFFVVAIPNLQTMISRVDPTTDVTNWFEFVIYIDGGDFWAAYARVMVENIASLMLSSELIFGLVEGMLDDMLPFEPGDPLGDVVGLLLTHEHLSVLLNANNGLSEILDHFLPVVDDLLDVLLPALGPMLGMDLDGGVEVLLAEMLADLMGLDISGVYVQEWYEFPVAPPEDGGENGPESYDDYINGDNGYENGNGPDNGDPTGEYRDVWVPNNPADWAVFEQLRETMSDVMDEVSFAALFSSTSSFDTVFDTVMVVADILVGEMGRQMMPVLVDMLGLDAQMEALVTELLDYLTFTELMRADLVIEDLVNILIPILDIASDNLWELLVEFGLIDDLVGDDLVAFLPLIEMMFGNISFAVLLGEDTELPELFDLLIAMIDPVLTVLVDDLLPFLMAEFDLTELIADLLDMDPSDPLVGVLVNSLVDILGAIELQFLFGEDTTVDMVFDMLVPVLAPMLTDILPMFIDDLLYELLAGIEDPRLIAIIEDAIMNLPLAELLSPTGDLSSILLDFATPMIPTLIDIAIDMDLLQTGDATLDELLLVLLPVFPFEQLVDREAYLVDILWDAIPNVLLDEHVFEFIFLFALPYITDFIVDNEVVEGLTILIAEEITRLVGEEDGIFVLMQIIHDFLVENIDNDELMDGIIDFIIDVLLLPLMETEEDFANTLEFLADMLGMDIEELVAPIFDMLNDIMGDITFGLYEDGRISIDLEALGLDAGDDADLQVLIDILGTLEMQPIEGEENQYDLLITLLGFTTDRIADVLNMMMASSDIALSFDDLLGMPGADVLIITLARSLTLTRCDDYLTLEMSLPLSTLLPLVGGLAGFELPTLPSMFDFDLTIGLIFGADDMEAAA